MKKTARYKFCEYCGNTLNIGEQCDCMEGAPRIHGRKYNPVRRKDGSIRYYGFPESMEKGKN